MAPEIRPSVPDIMQIPANPPPSQVQGQTVQPAAGHGRQSAAAAQRQGGGSQQRAESLGAVQSGREAPRQNVNAAEYDRNAPRGTYLNIVI